MLKKNFKNNDRPAGLGLEHKPGDGHYRAYVGPPRNYDLVSAMVFNLLTCLGLRQHHRVLDIGCGSLRSGRLLIPYLNPTHYIGVEPNKWLVEDGIRNETGEDLLRIKKPIFSFQASLQEFSAPLNIDYAIAQSIFSHCGRDLLDSWLAQISPHLKESGVLLATFLPDETDFAGSGWIYPDCVKYRPETIAELASSHGFQCKVIDWAHPGQTWAVFAKQAFDWSLIDDEPISWNRSLRRVMAQRAGNNDL